MLKKEKWKVQEAKAELAKSRGSETSFQSSSFSMQTEKRIKPEASDDSIHVRHVKCKQNGKHLHYITTFTVLLVNPKAYKKVIVLNLMAQLWCIVRETFITRPDWTSAHCLLIIHARAVYSPRATVMLYIFSQRFWPPIHSHKQKSSMIIVKT